MSSLQEWLNKRFREYAGDADRPMWGYVRAMATYATAVGGISGVAALTGRRVPESIRPWDVVMLGLATHKLSRLIAKDPVTSPLRAPFASFEGESADAEVKESVRVHGSAHAIGELITCPFCIGQWIATGFSAGTVLAPRLTRLAMSTFAGVAVSDFLQQAYAATQRAALS